MKLGLEDKIVLVTGGTKSIGRAIVEGFLAEGAIVHFCARTQSTIDSTVSPLSATYPSHVFGAAVDVSSPPAITAWVSSILASHGGIDVVVSNVSSLSMNDDAAGWDAAFSVDIRALTTLVHATTESLAARRGALVAIASVSGRDVDFTAPAPYGAVKAAVVHYVAQLAHTLAPRGVRAVSVSPGNIYVADGVWGAIERGQPEVFNAQMAKNPMGRMGRPEEVADAVVWVSSRRAGFVSGTNLVVDGALCTGVQL